MTTDIASLRKHYQSLSDEALLDLDRAELTEVAQQCYDAELAERNLVALVDSEEPVNYDNAELHVIRDPEPEWAGEAACVCTFTSSAGRNTAPDAANAQQVLQGAGIACYLASRQLEEVEDPTYELRVMVPGQLSLPAQSVLDKEIFNTEVEAEWRTYFENLTDEEFRDTDTKKLFGGLLDRIARLTKAYEDETVRRQA